MKMLSYLIRTLFGYNIFMELKLIKKYYYFSFQKRNIPNIIIYSLDNRTFQNGFADRLRGIVSAYAYAKLNNLQFKIDHKEPFCLEVFFEPNRVNWVLKESERTNNLLYSSPIVLLDYTKGTRLLHLSKKRQYHIYSNINALQILNVNYSSSLTYHGLFNELFKPSKFLLENIKPYEFYINKGFISISFRFIRLMGDFDDCCGYTLSDNKQQELISTCHSFIRTIHERHNNIPYVLVTTDSKKFLDSVVNLDYVFVIPGKIGHIGYGPNYEANVKTMLDFYMISQAKKAYLGCSDGMYESSFAKYAAETTGIEFEKINF